MDEANNIRTVAVLSAISRKRVQCAGPHFMKYLSRTRHGIDGSLSNASSDDKISDTDIEIEIDIDYLRSLNPKEWKDQDHYHVLGLKKHRFNASEDDIRRAYRRIVLKHHPDKRKAQGEDVHTDDDYFTCITKAYEILGNPTKRRSYDSVDPDFDDSLPTTTEIERNFYKIFNKYFSLNSRWCEKKNVPEIGDENSTRSDVDHFYSFWYDFESWREYSYLDEEDKDKGQDREERRWIEKQNKTIRIKRKKEEMARIRALVDLAYNNDPRIVKFRNDDKEKKQAAKRARMSAAQAQRAEEERILKEAQLAKEKAEQAEQKRIEQIRLEKEQQKRALKKEKKVFRDLTKEQNYYSTNEKEKLRNMEGVEKICEMLKLIELQNLNKELIDGGRELFTKVLNETEDKLEEERKALFSTKPSSTSTTHANATKNPAAVTAVDKNALWSAENMQLLIKAVNLFPAGTVQRWDIIANYLNQHGSTATNHKFTARDVLNKAKDLQSSDFTKNSLKSQANDNAFASFEKTKRDVKIIDKPDISVNADRTNESKKNIKQNGIENSKQIGQENCSTAPTSTQVNCESTAPIKSAVANELKPWTKDEQALLEQAIKTYPISTVDRWDRIAECLPNRTKKECLRRVKELVDRVNAKREATQIVK